MYELPKRLSATELLQSRSTHNLLAKALDREENLDDKSRIEYLELFLSKQSSQTAPNIDTLPILETLGSLYFSQNMLESAHSTFSDIIDIDEQNFNAWL